MLTQPGTDDPQGLLNRYDQARALTMLLLVAFTCLAVIPLLIVGVRAAEALTFYFAFRQDSLLVPVFLAAMLLRPRPANGERSEWLRSGALALGLSAVLILAAGWAGHYLVFQDYDLSRDEQLAVFDQGIFAHGKLFWPILPEWRDVADALNRRFLLPIRGDEIWVSGYLPVHAAFRALVSLFADPALSSPILAVIAAGSLWSVTRRLWPDSQSTSVVALVLLVTSSQFLITAMTAFSMTMHLALNLLWLALFLRDRWPTHAAAAVVGFLATGIHQPLFHPLFVLPFFLLLLGQRRWRVLAFYTLAYGLIALFWMWWPLFISSHGTAANAADCLNHGCSSGGGFVDRFIGMLNSGQTVLQHVCLMAENLLRFAVWQHPLLLPLAVFAGISCWKADPLVRALTLGLILPIPVLAVLLPWQGHAWGYRYLHPVLGNAVLLACYGFKALEDRSLSVRRPLIITTGVAVLLLGVHAWMAAQLAAPFVQSRDELAALRADVVIVDAAPVPFAEDVVFNRFDLLNRPILLVADKVKPENLPPICKRSTIAFYEAQNFANIAHLFVWRDPTGPTARTQALRKSAKAMGCRIVESGKSSAN